MLFAHDTEVALTAAAALVNTGRDGTEQLPDLAALDRFVAAWRWTGERAHDQAELDAVRRLRPRLERLWEMNEDDAARLVGQDNLCDSGAACLVPRPAGSAPCRGGCAGNRRHRFDRTATAGPVADADVGAERRVQPPAPEFRKN